MGEHKANPFARGTAVIRPARVKDGFGRELKVGDQVTLTSSGVVLFNVQEIAPNLDPGAPPNLMRVVLTAGFPMLVASDQPVREVLRVATAEELGRAVTQPDGSENGGDPLITEDKPS